MEVIAEALEELLLEVPEKNRDDYAKVPLFKLPNGLRIDHYTLIDVFKGEVEDGETIDTCVKLVSNYLRSRGLVLNPDGGISKPLTKAIIRSFPIPTRFK